MTMKDGSVYSGEWDGQGRFKGQISKDGEVINTTDWQVSPTAE